MSDTSLNPFADYGSIVSGERFLGRADGLRRIDARIVRPNRPGNLAIIGEPKIGKSSLAYQAIITRRSQLEERGLVPIWSNLGTYSESSRLFTHLVELAADELRRLGRLDGQTEELARRVGGQPTNTPEAVFCVRDFFKAVKRQRMHVLVVLDEFDHARVLFRGNPAAFQTLRDLSYYPEFGVAYLTTSRRTLDEIEKQSVAGSTLANTFQQFFLGLFSEADLDAFFDRLATFGPDVDAPVREQILRHAGGHPFLLDVLGFWLVEQRNLSGSWDMEAAADLARDDFLSLFDHIADLLREDHSLGRLLQIVFGPTVDVRPIDIDHFLRCGLIVCDRDGTFRPFSDTFGGFLQMLDREVQGNEELCTLWRRTEKELRQLIVATLHRAYGDSWLTRLEKAHPSVGTILSKSREAQTKEAKSFAGRASQNLLDFTYPSDLFAIISAEWQQFKPLLGREKAYWNERGTLLSKVRNPLAHNRDELLYEWERKTAEAYCQEILAVIQAVRTGGTI